MGTLIYKHLSDWLAQNVNNLGMLYHFADAWPAYTFGMKFCFIETVQVRHK